MTTDSIAATGTEIGLRKTIKLAEYHFEAAIDLVCKMLGIGLPTEGPEIEHEGQPYRVFRFEWPDDAAAFLAHFKKTDYVPLILSGLPPPPPILTEALHMAGRSKRSFTPYDAKQMLPVVDKFHWEVRKWLAQVPIGSPVYVALTVVNDDMQTTGNVMRGDMDRMWMQNDNAGGPSPREEQDDENGEQLS